jgi:hypothetical protein
MIKSKGEIIAFILPTLLLAIAISGLIPDISMNSPTGFIIANNSDITEINATSSISQAEKDISELEKLNFTTTYLNDILIESKNLLGKNNYKDAFEKSQQISFRKSWTYNISDSIRALEIIIEESETESIKANALFEKAKESFSYERYEETELFIEQAHEHIEEDKAKNTIIEAQYNAVKDNTLDFVKSNWIYITLGIILIITILAIFYEKIYIYTTKRKILMIKIEENVLVNLIKKAQDDRFNKGSISQSLYKAKMNSYRKRNGEIAREEHELSKTLNDPPSLFKMLGLKKVSPQNTKQENHHERKEQIKKEHITKQNKEKTILKTRIAERRKRMKTKTKKKVLKRKTTKRKITRKKAVKIKTIKRTTKQKPKKKSKKNTRKKAHS